MEVVIDYVPQTRESRLRKIPIVKKVEGEGIAVVSDSEKTSTEKSKIPRRKMWLAIGTTGSILCIGYRRYGHLCCSSVERIYNYESPIIMPNIKSTNTLNLTFFWKQCKIWNQKTIAHFYGFWSKSAKRTKDAYSKK
jgi:hypothetical protein